MNESCAKFLESLPNAEREAVMSLARPWQAAAEVIMYRAGEMPSGLWMLDVGFMRYEGHVHVGGPVVSAFSGPGACFGGGELFERHPSAVTAITTLPCEGWYLPAALALEAAVKIPAFAMLLLEKLARNVRVSQTLCSLALTLQPGERLALAILNLAQCMSNRPEAVRVAPFTQERLCQITGCSRQFVSRQIGKWVRMGWIASRYGSVELLDRQALQSIFPATIDLEIFTLLPDFQEPGKI